MNLAISILIDGVSYGMVLFIISIGLSITMGLLRVINMAHGGFAMIGGFIAAFATARFGASFEVALVVSVVAVAMLSIPIERLLMRRVYARDELDQTLLTIGMIFVMMAAVNLMFGSTVTALRIPDYLAGSITVADHTFPKYRILVLGAGLGVAAGLWYLIERTPFGIQVRAAVDNASIAQTVGVDTPRLYTLAFAMGAGLAALGGVIGAQLLPMEPGYALKYLVLFLAVVTVGGLGTVGGTLAAALFLGVIDTAAKYLLPDIASVALFLAMFVVLSLRPNGLFGRMS